MISSSELCLQRTSKPENRLLLRGECTICCRSGRATVALTTFVSSATIFAAFTAKRSVSGARLAL